MNYLSSVIHSYRNASSTYSVNWLIYSSSIGNGIVSAPNDSVSSNTDPSPRISFIMADVLAKLSLFRNYLKDENLPDPGIVFILRHCLLVSWWMRDRILTLSGGPVLWLFAFGCRSVVLMADDRRHDLADGRKSFAYFGLSDFFWKGTQPGSAAKLLFCSYFHIVNSLHSSFNISLIIKVDLHRPSNLFLLSLQNIQVDPQINGIFVFDHALDCLSLAQYLLSRFQRRLNLVPKLSLLRLSLLDSSLKHIVIYVILFWVVDVIMILGPTLSVLHYRLKTWPIDLKFTMTVTKWVLASSDRVPSS